MGRMGRSGRFSRWVVMAGFALSAALSACAPAGKIPTPNVPVPATADPPPAIRSGRPTAAPTVTTGSAAANAPKTQSELAATTGGPTAAPVTVNTVTPATLQSAVNAVVAQTPATVGFYALNYQSGQVVSANADLQVRSASLYKLFVLYSAYAQLTSGRMSPDESISLSHAAFVGDPYNEWTEGTSTTVSCALQYMIEVSSNSAAEMLIEREGGVDQVNADLQSLGLTKSVINDDTAYTSADDVARLLDLILTKRAVNPSASGAMLQLLLAQRHNDRLPMELPPGIAVAHKTGELDNLRNDAGVVFAPAGPYLFVSLVSNAQSEVYARDTIQTLSQLVYNAFEPTRVQNYDGLPPRLAAEVFQTPDAKGRLSPIDEWNELAPVAGSGVGLTSTAKNVRLQQPAIADLFAMQQAAANANATFWVRSGYASPRGIDAPMVNPTDAIDCKVAIAVPTPAATGAPADTPIPAPDSTPTPSPTPVLPPHASQQWLGTVAGVSDHPDGATTDDFASSATGRWLIDHAWEYGYLLALPESPTGNALGYEPWQLRWVGRDLAKSIHDLGPATSNRAAVTAELQQAEATLAAEAERNRQLTRSGK